jgi:hypothetical protein
MEYYDSTCTFNQLVAKNAFVIDRHALRIIQPLVEDKKKIHAYLLDCPQAIDGTRRFGRIDFARGFPHWWYLSHIDFHVPSEHTQEGKRYDGELHMYHFYSVSGEEAGINNEVRTIICSLFL